MTGTSNFDEGFGFTIVIGTERVFWHSLISRRPVIHHCSIGYERRKQLIPKIISKESVLSKFWEESCLDLRQLAARHGVDASNEALYTAVGDLRRTGRIHRIGGQGRRMLFVLAS